MYKLHIKARIYRYSSVRVWVFYTKWEVRKLELTEGKRETGKKKSRERGRKRGKEEGTRKSEMCKWYMKKGKILIFLSLNI